MNKVFLIGNLTRDPELRTTASSKSVCSFSIAVNRAFSNQQGEKVTDFFNIIVWGKLGENCAKYLSKGRKVAVMGEIQNRSYEKDGVKRTVTEIIASDVEFLTARDSQGDSSYSQREYSAPARKTAPMTEEDSFTELSDEDLPF